MADNALAPAPKRPRLEAALVEATAAVQEARGPFTAQERDALVEAVELRAGALERCGFTGRPSPSSGLRSTTSPKPTRGDGGLRRAAQTTAAWRSDCPCRQVLCETCRPARLHELALGYHRRIWHL